MTDLARRIVYETPTHYVAEVGARGFEVYRNGACAAVKVASIGHGPAPNLGIARAMAECDRRSKGEGGSDGR